MADGPTHTCVVVTGAGRGLGLDIARRVGRDGAQVVVAEIDAERGKAAVASLADDGLCARLVVTDIADEASVAALADNVGRAGGLTGLVNNAAMAEAVGGQPFWDIDSTEFDRLMKVNVRGTWLVSKYLAPQLIDQGAGSIVNIASDTFFLGSERLAHYVASKGSVIGLTRAMARDLGPHGVTVNAVAPGIVESESTTGIPQHRHDWYAENRALARSQRPADVSGAVAFLLSGDADYMTGTTLVIDGGFVMH